MKYVKITKGYSAVVDDEDYELVSQYKWQADTSSGTSIYACCHIKQPDGSVKNTKMHNLILPLREGLKTDHKDGNGLNNRRHNLRRATSSQNTANSRPYGKYTYKGISPRPSGLWRSRITHNAVTFSLGDWETKELAATAYDKAAILKFEEFALTNFPRENYI